MTWLHEDNNERYEPPEEPEEKRWFPAIVAVGLAIVGVSLAFAWRTYGDSPYPSFAFGSSSAVTIEPKTAPLDEFRAFEQQIAGQLQSSAQALAAQQVEVKRLSDQMAAVAAKIDALQSSMSSARANIPPVEPPRAPPKKPTKPKPLPSISTGGAPLPSPTQLTH